MLLSEAGHEHAENILTDAGLLAAGTSLYDAHNISLVHHLYAALRAHALFHRDQHYVVQNGEVIIVDEFTGRLMAGRRWSDGLHQAVEAKEGVPIQRENQTLASITFQNYFRMYERLAGMTGTADTEAFEFQQIYRLETVVIPTHLPMVRRDENDLVFRTLQEKIDAIIGDIRTATSRPAGAGRHDFDREFGVALRLPGEAEAAAPGAQRQAACARSRNRRPGGPPEDDHHRDQHGRARHRHRARRRCRAADAGDPRGRRRCRRPRGTCRSASCARSGRSATTRSSPPAGCTSSAPSGTSRAASTTSCAAAPGARATRARRASTCRWRIPLLRIFGGERLSGIMQRLKMPEGEPIEHRSSIARSRKRRTRRIAQLRHAQAAARIRRRRQ